MTEKLVKFTLDDLAREVIKLAEESPDYVYESPVEAGTCYYSAKGNTQGCIFGQALKRLGVTDEFLAQVDSGYLQLRCGMSITSVLEYLGFANDIKAPTYNKERDLIIAMRKVQGNQDFGERWADAVDNLRELGY